MQGLENFNFHVLFLKNHWRMHFSKMRGELRKKPYRSGDWKANKGLKGRESSGWLWEQMLGFCVGNDGNQTKLEERRSRSRYVKSNRHHAFCHCTTTLNSWTLTGCVPPKQKSKTMRKKEDTGKQGLQPRWMGKIIPRTMAKPQDNGCVAVWRVTRLDRGEPWSLGIMSPRKNHWNG